RAVVGTIGHSGSDEHASSLLLLITAPRYTTVQSRSAIKRTPYDKQDTPFKPTRFQSIRPICIRWRAGILRLHHFCIFCQCHWAFIFSTRNAQWLVLIQTFGIFAAGYLVRPIGGIVMAHFGDRVGRKRMFALSVLLMSLATLGM